MKYIFSIFSIFLVLMLPLLFVSCGKDIPTVSQVSPSFEITDIKALTPHDYANLVVTATYQTTKDEPFVSGVLHLGDGSTAKIQGIQLYKDRTKWQSDNIFHFYNIPGPSGTQQTFLLRAEITVPFKTGAVTSVFQKEITFTKR